MSLLLSWTLGSHSLRPAGRGGGEQEKGCSGARQWGQQGRVIRAGSPFIQVLLPGSLVAVRGPGMISWPLPKPGWVRGPCSVLPQALITLYHIHLFAHLSP